MAGTRNFLMPMLGADMAAGTLVAWRKRPGDPVRRGETIAEVDTEKGVIDVEVFLDGVLERIVVEPGTRVPVGTVLATIRGADEPAAASTSAPHPAVAAAPPGQPPAGPAETGEERPRPPAEPPVSVPPERPPVPRYAPGLDLLGRLRISPAARRLARELSVDPAQVTGAGPGGAITCADIERAARQPPPPPGPAPAPAPGAAAERLRRMRQSIAAAMTRSKREIPHYYLWTTIDLGRAGAWLAAENDRRPPERRLLPGVLLLKATALALREVPELNAVWERDAVVVRDTVHVGVAIALRQGGLVILALHDTATRGVDDLMAGLRDMTVRARTGRMRSSELADSTITVTSLGDRGVEGVLGAIYPPQVAIVGFGTIGERPLAVDGGIFVRQAVTVTLAGDHRASDGHRGGLFLDAIGRLLQEPEKL